MEDQPHGYILTNWVPPWVDDGKAFISMLEQAKATHMTFDGWLLLSLFFAKQLDYDLERVKKQNLNIGP